MLLIFFFILALSAQQLWLYQQWVRGLRIGLFE